MHDYLSNIQSVRDHSGIGFLTIQSIHLYQLNTVLTQKSIINSQVNLCGFAVNKMKPCFQI